MTIENRMALCDYYKEDNDMTDEQVKELFKEWHIDGNSSSDNDIFIMWAESYENAIEIISDNVQQAEKAKRDLNEYKAKTLMSEFEAQTGNDICLSSVIECL